MKNLTIPYVTENTSKGTKTSDVFSRLLEDRIVLLSGEIENNLAKIIIAQLLFLDNQSHDEPINLYINSPGGSVVDGLAIIDTMNLISAPVHTYCMGMCASMGAMILSQGEKGHRYCLPNGEVMIHQPLGGAKGQATDIEISANRIIKMKKKLIKMLAEACNQDYEKVYNDCERDYYLDAEEALEYGIIDKVLQK